MSHIDSTETPAEVDAARDALIHTLVNFVDELGLGVEMVEHLGQEKFQALMAGYRAHEQAADRA